jgi:probable addiction module antidote protein
MSEKFVETPIEPHSSRRDIADRISRAFATSDITAICHAIGDATRLHNISDIARQAELERTSIYPALPAKNFQIFQTVLRILDAMGFQLKVTERRGNRAASQKAKLKILKLS